MPNEPTPWVEGLTIGEVLCRTAAAFPDHDAALSFHSLGFAEATAIFPPM